MTIHFCMVKYGDTVQGRPANELVRDIVKPVYESCRALGGIKFHLLTDRKSNLVPNYVNYIELSKEDIDNHEHWVKTYFFDPEFIGASVYDQTIVVDIDMDWNDNPFDVIHYRCGKRQFVSMNRWWRDNEVDISGNFYKFNSHDFKHVAEIYKKHWRYFRKYYYKNGWCGEKNHGEQYFVYDMVKSSDIVLQPPEWCMKYHEEKHPLYAERFLKETGKDYYECYDNAKWHFVGIK